MHYQKAFINISFNGHIKYNFVMYLQISSISFFSQAAHLWYDGGLTIRIPMGIFLPPLCHSHRFTHSHRVYSCIVLLNVICLLNNNNDVQYKYTAYADPFQHSHQFDLYNNLLQYI